MNISSLWVMGCEVDRQVARQALEEDFEEAADKLDTIFYQELQIFTGHLFDVIGEELGIQERGLQG